jgi:uncharacterized membrane protein YdjX (TVP38/TMEM64 family)
MGDIGIKEILLGILGFIISLLWIYMAVRMGARAYIRTFVERRQQLNANRERGETSHGKKER